MRDLFTLSAFMFYGIALVAMLGHALKKWAYGEIRGGLVDWYLTHPRASVAALMGCITGVVGAILSGMLIDPAQGAQVTAAAGIGWGADTFNNQGGKHA